jgi:hypothetical protein
VNRDGDKGYEEGDQEFHGISFLVGKKVVRF